MPLWAHRVDWKWLHPCNWMQFYPSFAEPRADIQSLGQHSGLERAGSDATKTDSSLTSILLCVYALAVCKTWLNSWWHPGTLLTYSRHSFPQGSEKATKIWWNLQTFFDVNQRSDKLRRNLRCLKFSPKNNKIIVRISALK